MSDKYEFWKPEPGWMQTAFVEMAYSTPDPLRHFDWNKILAAKREAESRQESSTTA